MWSHFPFLLHSSVCVGKCMESCTSTSTMSRNSSLTPAFPSARLGQLLTLPTCPRPCSLAFSRCHEWRQMVQPLSLAPSMEHDASEVHLTCPKHTL